MNTAFNVITVPLGTKTGYATTEGDYVKLRLDCNVEGCSVVVKMMPDQFLRWQHPNRGLIQDIFPLRSNEVREMLITGITPQEWQAMFGEKSFTYKELVAFGYQFDSN